MSLPSGKGVLDNMEIKEQGFPLNKNLAQSTKLEVVGNCPKCAAPIYGPKQVTAESQIDVRHTCDCSYQKSKSITDTMQTK